MKSWQKYQKLSQEKTMSLKDVVLMYRDVKTDDWNMLCTSEADPLTRTNLCNALESNILLTLSDETETLSIVTFIIKK